ncbi:MAG: ribose 5-phosphate isomerase B [Candidatus Margulisiibacteriota bacterium]
MKVAIASDHAGFKLKEEVKSFLKKKKYIIKDLGAYCDDYSVDYPDYAKKTARLVSSKKVPKGILICGSGIGMSIAANRFKGIRAAACESMYTAKMCRKHNDANILCLGARILPKEMALKIVDVWISTKFEGGRHKRRVRKL